MQQLTEVQQVKDALENDRSLRLDFFAAVGQAFRSHGKEIHIDLLLNMWLELNDKAVAEDQQAGPWGRP